MVSPTPAKPHYLGIRRQQTLTERRLSPTDIAGYKVYYGTSSKNYNMVIDVGNITTYTVLNLNDGTLYYFAVTVYADNYESTYSNEVGKTISTTINTAGALLTDSLVARPDGNYESRIKYVDANGNILRISSFLHCSLWPPNNLTISPNGSGAVFFDYKGTDLPVGVGRVVGFYIDSTGARTGYFQFDYDSLTYKPVWYSIRDDKTGKLLLKPPACTSSSCPATLEETKYIEGETTFQNFKASSVVHLYNGSQWVPKACSAAVGKSSLLWDNNVGTAINWFLDQNGNKYNPPLYSSYPYDIKYWSPLAYALDGSSGNLGNMSWLEVQNYPSLIGKVDATGKQTGYFYTSSDLFDFSTERLINYDGK